jgi:DNA-binding transcriptional LysR family regulator
MDINSLYTLIAIAEHGSFTEAARQLNLSDSTVSLQVSAAERECGKTLFDRSHRPPSLTSAGHIFIRRARDIVRQWEQLRGAESGGHMTGALKIGAVHTVVTDTLPGALLELRKQAPELSVRLVTGLTNDLINRVVRQNLDCAVVTIPDHVPPNVVCFPVYSDPLVVMAHADAKGRTARALLENNPYVRFSPHAEVAHIVDRLLRDRNIKVNTRMEIDTLDAVMSLVRSGLGVSVVPASRELRDNNLRILQFGSARTAKPQGASLRNPGSGNPGSGKTGARNNTAKDAASKATSTRTGKPGAIRSVGVVTHRDSPDKGIVELLVGLLRSQT